MTTMMQQLSILLVLCLQSIHPTHSWSILPPKTEPSSSTQPTLSRRSLIDTLTKTTLTSLTLTTTPLPSHAASSGGVTLEDLQRIQRGHARVMYLLNNWESITETCARDVRKDPDAANKQVVRTDAQYGVCEKNPLVVQEYLGYKSTLDPLFKIDKIMVKAANSKFVDPDIMEDYLDVVEKYREKADMGSMMAYTSSWGEANPNGGKDIIEEYLKDTKVEVQQTADLLKSILGYLKLDVLPPSKAV